MRYHILYRYIGWLVWLLYASLWLVSAQGGESMIELKGYILDRERQPIPLATVRLSGTTLGTVANLKGYYSLRLRPTADSVTIIYSSLGYRSSIRRLPRLVANTQLTVELAEDAEALSQVVVEARDRSSAAGAQRLDPSKLNLGSSPAGAVEALVGTLSGVTQKNELSSQYTVRGGNFDENLVYIDGVEIYRPMLARSAEQEGLSAINPDLTESLTFSAGGFSADYGDKSSSVLDIRYKRPDSLEGAALLGLLESRLYLGSRHGRLRQITGVRYKRASTLLSTLDTKAEYDPHYFDAQTALTYEVNPSIRLNLLGHFNGTNYHFMPRTRLTSFGTLHNAKQLRMVFDGQEVDHFRTYLGALTLDYQPSSRVRHRVGLMGFTSHERETYDITGEYILSDVIPDGSQSATPDNPLDNQLNALGIGRDRSHARNRMTYTLLGFSARTQIALAEQRRLLLGLEIRGEEANEVLSEWRMRDSVGYTLPRSTERLSSLYHLRSLSVMRGLRLASWIEGRLSWSQASLGDLALQAGLRASWWSWSRELIVSPRLSLRFRPESIERLELRLASGIYLQAPRYRELKQERAGAYGEHHIELNRSIRSSSTWLLLGGADYDFELMRRRFRLSGEVYYKYLWDQNPYIQENIKLRYLGNNTGRGYIVGVDAKLYGEFVEGVDSWVSLSLLRGRQRIEGGAETPLPNAPAYNASLFFQDYFPGFKPIRLSLRGVYSAGLPVMHPRGEYDAVAFVSSPYRRVDVGLTYRLTDRASGARQHWWSGRHLRSIDLGLDVLNLFDMVNTSSYYWVTDAYQHQYAVPNYLTRRSWSFSLRIGL